MLSLLDSSLPFKDAEDVLRNHYHSRPSAASLSAIDFTGSRDVPLDKVEPDYGIFGLRGRRQSGSNQHESCREGFLGRSRNGTPTCLPYHSSRMMTIR